VTLLGAGTVTPGDITTFLLSITALVGLARILGEVSRRFGQPTVMGEIIAGVLLGPTLLGAVAPEIYHALFPSYVGGPEAAAAAIEAGQEPVPHPVRHGLDLLTTLSVCLLLLVAGLEVDLASALRQGKATLMVSMMGVLLPFAVGSGLGFFTPGLLGKVEGANLLPFALFMGITMSITALPVIARILMDLNMLKTDLGMLIMGSALINDLLGWIGFALVLAMISIHPEAAEAGPGLGVSGTIALTLGFVAVMLTLGRWAAHRAMPFIQANTPWPGGPLTFVLMCALLGSAFTEWIGIHAIFGAFIVGIALGDSRHLRQRTRNAIEQFVGNLFAPLFFAGVGLRVNFIEAFDPLLVVVVVALAIAAKVFGCFFGARIGGVPLREAWATGFGMCALGAMAIILGQLALAAGLIDEQLFVAIVVMSLVTSLLPGPAIQRLLQRQQPRRLSDLLDAKAFVPRLEAQDSRSAIGELAEAAARRSGVQARTINDAAWSRERVMATGLTHGIAVPHARLDGLKQPLIAVGLSEEGVDFDAPDGEPARIVCLLLCPAEDPGEQVEMLGLVANAFGNPQARHEATTAANFTEFRAAVSVVEGEAEGQPETNTAGN
jgi:Kef-type K+ transport system membrane component KefB